MNTVYINSGDSTSDSLTSSTISAVSIPSYGAGGTGYTINTGAGGGGSGSTLTYNTGAINWSTSYSSPYNDPNVSITTDGISMKEGTDIKIGEKSLKNILERLEEKLAVLYPNEELEAKWEQLRDLRKQYMDLEEELKQKEKMWKILKEK